MTHDELQSLLGAYAIDALDPDEEVILESHLSECPRCRAEVAAHRETAALLGNVGGDAPSRVWERIAAELSFENARPPMTPPNVLPLRRPLPLAVVAAVAAAAVALVGLLGVSTIRLQHRVDTLRDTISAGGLQQAAAAAVLDPHHTNVKLVSVDGRVTASVVVRPDGDAYLIESNLPLLDPAHTYQLWGLDDGKIVSLGLLGTAPRLVAFRIDSAVLRLIVTEEPEGGRPQPDTQIRIQGNLRT